MFSVLFFDALLQFTDKIAALVAELEHSKAQLEAAEERDFQKGITLMKLEEALAKSNADMTSSTSMHSRHGRRLRGSLPYPGQHVAAAGAA